MFMPILTLGRAVIGAGLLVGRSLFVVLCLLWLVSGVCAGQSAASADTGGQVGLKVVQWGVGNVSRPGSWIGVQVQVTDQGQTTREILLELAVPDSDGDTTNYQTTLALGGEQKSTWIYARLPFSLYNASFTGVQLNLSAYTLLEPSAAQRDAGVAKPGSRIGFLRFTPPAPVDPQSALFGVIGRSSAGLGNYRTDAGFGSRISPMAHERGELVGPLTVGQLPDRWMGLAGFETIVWAGSGPELEPTDLPEDRASAIRQWVERGGHLVIVLPTVGQSWTNPGQPIADLFPKVSVIREEGVDLNPFRPLLTDRKVDLPTSGTVQIVEPRPGAKPDEAIRVLTGPDGRAVVSRRLVGCGMVTVVGLDVGGRTLESVGGIRPDVFWHRVLGRRGQLLSEAEIDRARQPGFTGPKNFTNRQSRAMDQDIAGLINKTGQAFAGVMLAFLLFGAYWIVAGPLGFWLIRRRGEHKHAWVGFVVVGAVFTAVAWGGASVLKPGRSDAQHLTIIDHVYGQDVDRARVWASVLLPRFGLMRVAIGGSDASVGNTLAPWDPPPSELAKPTDSSFADSQNYGLASRNPASVLTPSRSTTKSYVGEWLGGPPWSMPLPMSEDGATPGALRLLPADSQRQWMLDGTLKHDLPGELTDVYLVLVRYQRPVKNGEMYIGQMQAEGDYIVRKSWKPGEVWNVDSPSDQWLPLWRPGPGSSLLRDLVGRPSDQFDGGWGGGGSQATVTPGRVQERLVALSLFGQLEPPDARDDGRQVLAQRSDAHRWDLARYFTQPCVIVIGQMADAPSPVPLTLDGEPLGSTGRVVVRWVYPLPENPPRFTGN